MKSKPILCLTLSLGFGLLGARAERSGQSTQHGEALLRGTQIKLAKECRLGKQVIGIQIYNPGMNDIRIIGSSRKCTAANCLEVINLPVTVQSKQRAEVRVLLSCRNVIGPFLASVDLYTDGYPKIQQLQISGIIVNE
jgi:hypothetical protein